MGTETEAAHGAAGAAGASTTGDAMSGAAPRAGIHLPLLLVGIAIMVAGTAFPFIMSDASGEADHGIAMALLWAMAAGFVRGVGFVPRHRVWRWLFSGIACVAALVLYAVLRWTG